MVQPHRIGGIAQRRGALISLRGQAGVPVACAAVAPAPGAMVGLGLVLGFKRHRGLIEFSGAIEGQLGARLIGGVAGIALGPLVVVGGKPVAGQPVGTLVIPLLDRLGQAGGAAFARSPRRDGAPPLRECDRGR